MSSLSRVPSTDYRDLKQLVMSRGLLESNVPYYVMKTVVTVGLLAVACAIAIFVDNTWILMADAVFLAFVSTQVAMLGHDVGHRQGFRGKKSNKWARFLFGGLLLGISPSWWNNKHNQHHATPNHLDLDPDIQFPMIVFAPSQIANRSKKLRPLIAFQAFVFVAVLPLQAINMRRTSFDYLRSGKAPRPWFEGFGMVLHLVLYVALLATLPSVWTAIAFALVHQAAFGLYNSSVFASNHKGMATIDSNHRLDFLREQVLTARNVHGNWFIDFWTGGLNYQIEHHLFPTMPRCNLKKAQVLVQQFCEERGVSYHATNLVEAYWEGFKHLHETSASLRRGGSGSSSSEARAA